MFGFERLEVWQAAIGFGDEVYRVTKEFPADERFGLTSQMRRAAISVSSNIAEGSGRVSSRDFARFVEIAFGSLMETVSQLSISHRQGLITSTEYDSLYQSAQRIARMLSGLRTSLERK